MQKQYNRVSVNIAYGSLLKIILLTVAVLSGPCSVLAQETAKAQKTDLVIPPFHQVAERTPQGPLKTRRVLYTDEMIAFAQKNIATDPQAKEVQDRILKAAAPWLDWSDTDLRRLIPDARVPRGFDLSVKGCPVHGDEVFKHGRYSWIIDVKKPFTVKCPVGQETYPSNDYGSYYHSNFKEKKGWNTKYVDDGWGWIGPDGERYWFVAYANHWMWYRINSAISNLSQAYLLTGDKRYAHKAAVMLYRFAAVYPSMDHAKQSRYGLMSAATGVTYNGKVLNSIWETGLARQAVESYDMIWDSIDDDTALHAFYTKSGEQIRAFIEANLLEDIIDAYFERKISGNFGMHQNTLLHTVLVREHKDREKYLHMLVDEPNKSAGHSGIRYALYNSVFRDGLPYESPHYNALWIGSLSTIIGILNKGGLNLADEPRLRMLYDGQLDGVAIGKFTPAIGDSGSALGELIGSNDAYKIAYDLYQDPDYLSWLSKTNRNSARKFSGFSSLFRLPLPQAKQLPGNRAVKQKPSRLFAGYGLGMLNNKSDNSGLSLTYGYHGSHFHWDFLNFELFANGQKMMPDLGYPDQMNNYVPGIYTWSTNTVAHNTVVVDAAKQVQNKPGVLHSFADGSFARSIDASSPAYPQTSRYRRSMIMVDVDENQSYTVDIFRVEGGKQHDYSLHGPPGEVTTQSGTWSAELPGTLAGPQVSAGQIYDDKVLGQKGYSGKFNSYRGSGFQHLFNVNRLEEGSGIINYRHTLDKNAQLRIHLLPAEKQQVYMADAYDLPVKRSNTLKYVIARRQSAGNEDLKSTFVSVLEPYTSKAYIQSAKLLPLTTGNGIAVEVMRTGASDVIISDTSNVIKSIKDHAIETDATNAVVSVDKNGRLLRVFFSNGSFLRYKDRTFQAQTVRGSVIAVEPQQRQIRVQLDDSSVWKPADTAGRIAHFTNAFRTTVHPLAKITAQNKVLTISTQDALLVARLRPTQITAGIITTDTNLPFAQLYTGTTMLNKNLERIDLVKEVQKGTVSLANDNNASALIRPDEDIWLSNLGVGDKMEIKSNFSWSAGNLN